MNLLNNQDEQEQYLVKRAVFLAAGFGKRLSPVTQDIPKPLVTVKGKRIIDTLLDAVLSAGIQEIYIVRGYLKNQFDQLLDKYPNIIFIDNPYYNESNNISSVYCARHLLQNAYILEADLYLNNLNLINKYQYSSNYLGVPADYTDDWCFQTHNGIIKSLQIGGHNCYHMFGISYWNQSDGIMLSDHIKQVFESPEGKDLYWDQIPLEFFIDKYSIKVRECSFEDIKEIDTLDDLIKLDETWVTHLQSHK